MEFIQDWLLGKLLKRFDEITKANWNAHRNQFASWQKKADEIEFERRRDMTSFMNKVREDFVGIGNSHVENERMQIAASYYAINKCSPKEAIERADALIKELGESKNV